MIALHWSEVSAIAAAKAYKAGAVASGASHFSEGKVLLAVILPVLSKSPLQKSFPPEVTRKNHVGKR